MRAIALGIILFINLVIALTADLSIDPTNLSFLLTLCVVVVLAFGSSALLRNIQQLKMTRNYIVSGVIGVITGVFFFIWVKGNTEQLISWFEKYGLNILLLVNVLCALFLFFSKKEAAVVDQDSALGAEE